MMRMRGTICAATILLSIPGQRTALGDDIVYRFTGQTEEAAIQAGQTRPANADISIDVGEVSGHLDLWVYDYTRVANPNGGTLPDQSIGKLTITGSWAAGSLRVLLAGPDSVWPYVSMSQDSMRDPGVVNLGFLDANNVVHGGFDFRDANGQPNPDLQKHTRLAAFTSNDIYGDITVGQIQRVQAGNLTPAQPTGTIYAKLTALNRNNVFGPNEKAIGWIVAGNGIVGNIVAEGDESFDPNNVGTYADIDRILVGPSIDPATDPAPLGITGDVLAERGRIGIIHTTGPIGTPTPRGWNERSLTLRDGWGPWRRAWGSRGSIRS